MDIVPGVATKAGHRQFRSPFHCCLVAGIAVELGVCSIQLELGLAVVEVPHLPIARAVAPFALIAEPQLMNIVFLVAARTLHWDIAIGGSCVAFLAFDQSMGSCERKTRTIVIELLDLP